MRNVFAKTTTNILLVCLPFSVLPVAGHAAGTVVGWGNNSSGQTNLPPNLRVAVMVAAGESHSLTLGNDGAVTGWGANNYGQASSPVGLSDVMVLVAGGNHNLALMSNGTVTAWGWND